MNLRETGPLLAVVAMCVLAVVALSLFAIPALGDLAFTDVPDGHPYASAIADLSSRASSKGTG